MVIETRGKLGILSCEGGKHFAEKVIKEIKSKNKKEKPVFIDSDEIVFANTEIKHLIKNSIRGIDLYVFQDVENPVMINDKNYSVYDNIGSLKAAIDAAWRSDPEHITVVLPVFPYARQDKQKGREGISASHIAREIEDLNVNQIITLDVHNEAIAGFFRKAKFENLRASKNIIDYVKNNIKLEDLVVMSPDVGGAARAEYYARKLKADLAICYKRRDYSSVNNIKKMDILGDIKEKNILVIDDIIDTAGTLVKLLESSKTKGAKKVYAACSLPLFNGKAVERINNAYNEGVVDGVIGTDAVYHSDEFKKENQWYHEVSVASYFARVIMNLNQRKSISKLLE
jgi:ribose-phosphate pyrophosphokinase